MASKIILVAETGSDMPKELARELGVILIPMHVCMGDDTLDDGTFPPEDVCAYYDRTGKIPTTSGSTIYDFESVYERIFADDPNAQVLHLAYSAVTTCSYHSSELAIENKAYKQNVRLVDTKQVSVGQCAAVAAVAAWLKDHPEATLEEAAAQAQDEEDEEDDGILEMEDEEGNPVRFYLSATIPYEDETYVLLTCVEDAGDFEMDESIIMLRTADEDGEDCYQSLDDEALIEAVYNAYLEQTENT